MNHLKHTAGITRGAHDPDSRQIPFILSTPTRDRHGTVLNQDNWMLDNYLKNPIVGYAHNLGANGLRDPNCDMVIGKAIETGVIDRTLISTCQFESADLNPLADKIYRKLLFGSLNTCSVGFRELGKGKYGTGDQARGRPNETYYFEGQELIEFSVVNIPSNPEATQVKRTLANTTNKAALLYSLKHLGSLLRPGQIEALSINHAYLYCEALNLGIMPSVDKLPQIKAELERAFNRDMLERSSRSGLSDTELRQRAKLDIERASHLFDMALRPGIGPLEREMLFNRAEALKEKSRKILNELDKRSLT